MGETATRKARVYGARDAETNWTAITYVSTSIRVMVKFLGEIVRDTPQGRVTEVRARLYTASVLAERDLVTYDGADWEVEDITYKHLLLSSLGYYHATIVKTKL